MENDKSGIFNPNMSKEEMKAKIKEFNKTQQEKGSLIVTFCFNISFYFKKNK